MALMLFSLCPPYVDKNPQLTPSPWINSPSYVCGARHPLRLHSKLVDRRPLHTLRPRSFCHWQRSGSRLPPSLRSVGKCRIAKPQVVVACDKDAKKEHHPKGLCSFLAPPVGLAFLRKSHGGCDSPPDCRQEPPFESAGDEKRSSSECYCFFFGAPCWTRTNDLRINSPSLYRLS